MALPANVHISAATQAMLNERSNVSTYDRLALSLDIENPNYFHAALTDMNGGHASPQANRWAESTPGATRYKKKFHDIADHWKLQGTDFSVLRIYNSWELDKVTFTDNNAALLFSNILLRFLNSEVNAQAVQAWTETGEAPELPSFLVKPGASAPLPYQKLAVTNALRSQGFALFMEQGTGKTYPTIVVIANEAKKAVEQGKKLLALVVSPNAVRVNWEREIEKFCSYKLQTQVISGTQTERILALSKLFTPSNIPDDCAGSVAVCSYNAAGEIALILKTLGISDLSIIVIDESHNIKNPKARVTKEMHQARDMFAKRMVLTGTPVGNTPLDLWGQLEMLYPGASGFLDYSSFAKYYSRDVPPMASSVERLEAMLNVPLLRERLARNSFVISKAVALPHLPARTSDVAAVSMTTAQKAIYDSVALMLAAELEADMERAAKAEPSQRSLILNNALTKTLKLCQITSGFVKWDAKKDPITEAEIEPAWIEILRDNPKLDWLVEQLKERPADEKTLIWACMTPAITLISERLRAEGIKHLIYDGKVTEKQRQQRVDLFNDEHLRGKQGTSAGYNVMICNQGAAGPGLNLLGYPPGSPESSPCDVTWCVYFVQNYSYIAKAQSRDRCHRNGTRRPVRETDLICAKSIERKILEALEAKKEGALQTTDVSDILLELSSTLRKR